ncbi:hypothetical protein K458DRAFT_395424 [Lentithecium fluviatile CBS 122367]|uniref:3-carboxy-cis,cis-mucoante lactonizing enzyme n=1 Tax=Lentithecium fluviatile CBS 122367 TaxID=1168545 RepID=A0A6G1IJ26_9PLEO|nr:hypothetical protein K458DRAFT_395424 [Lentithecium fluviatile CBS 122367]
MLAIFNFLAIAGCATATLHHVYVGQTAGSFINALEIDDATRQVYLMGLIPASGASPSLVLAPGDYSKLHLFGSEPQKGTLTRYTVQPDYSLINEGTADIPASCNTTKFTTLHLTSGKQAPYSIFGSASTGQCSTLFSLTVSGFSTLRSREFAGDIRSLAWSPNGRHLHALDSHSSAKSATSIFNFFIAPEPTLLDQNITDTLANVTGATQMVTHPTGNLVYVVTDTNELVTISLSEDVSKESSPSRYKILPSSIDASMYTTSSLTISSSKTSLWTLSQSNLQAVITVFSLDATTGAVISAVARAAWSGYGYGQIAPAPFVGNDIVAITNSPTGIVAILGLDVGVVPAGEHGEVKVEGEEDGFLEEVWMLNVKRDGSAAVAPKLKSFGRIDLGFDTLGEGVWVD